MPITRHEYMLRLARAEEYLESGRWTIHDRLELCEEFGVSMATVCGWRDAVIKQQVDRFRTEVEDPELSTVRLLMSIRHIKRLFADTIRRTDGKNATPGPLIKLLELEARLLGLGDRTAARMKIEHSGTVGVLVENADPVAQARAVVQALPDAIRVLGLACDPEIERLPALLEDLTEGRDLLEAVEVEIVSNG